MADNVPTYPLGPWPVGMDNVSPETALAADDHTGRFTALRDAVNVDIDRAGRPTRRNGATPVVPLAGLHSLWAGRLGAYAGAGTTLYSVSPTGGLTAIGELNSPDPCAFAELNDGVVVTNRTTLLRAKGQAVSPLPIADANPPQVQAVPAGGLHAGQYAVAVSFLRHGVEGGLSALRSVPVSQGGGLQLTQLPTATDADTLRVYLTHPNGETLYHATDTGVGTPSLLLGAMPLGKAAPTQWLRGMPPGQRAWAWRGRLLVARNNVLYVSRPMQYHLFSPRHGFVSFPSRIRMLAGVDTGVFVGTDDGVVFLRGSRPREWAQESTGALPPLAGNAVEIPGGDTGLEQDGNNLVAWLAPNGYVIGRNDGGIVEPQAARVSLPTGRSAALAYRGRRLTAYTQ